MEKNLKSPAAKYQDLSLQIVAVRKHLDEIESTVKSKATLNYSKVEALNLELTKLVSRAGNACWE